MDSLEQKMKEKLMEGLIEHMTDQMGMGLESKFPKKAMEVSVAAPDEKALMEGLDKAKEVTGEASDGDREESDEDRLMQLLSEDEEDEDKLKKGY